VRLAARLAYVAVILLATWSGLDADPELSRIRERLLRALHPPLRIADVLDAVRNVALFAGFGAVWMATGDPTRLRREVVHATLLGTLLSVAVEVAQLFSSSRFASVLDVATNGAGSLLGALGVGFAIAVVATRRSRTGDAVVPHLLVAGAYLGACMMEAFSSLGRPDKVPDVWGGVSRRLGYAVGAMLRDPHVPPTWTDVLLFAPAGFLATRVLIERGRSPARAAVVASALGGATWLGCEVLRGASGGDLRPWAVLLRTAAAALGAAIAAALATREDRGAVAPADGGALVRLRRDPRAYVALILLWALRPFTVVDGWGALVAKLSADAFVPLRALSTSWSIHSVADVGIAFLLFVPVGAWFAVRPRPGDPTGLRARSPWPGLGLAAATELAQLPIAGRSFDVTDVLVQAGGVLVGWAIVRRADARRLRRATLRSAGAGRRIGESAEAAA
jgi:VanZ family protein